MKTYMKLSLAALVVAFVAACTPPVQTICKDEYIDKLNPSVQVCSDVAVGWSYFMQPTVTTTDGDNDRDLPKLPTGTPTGEDNDVPDEPGKDTTEDDNTETDDTTTTTPDRVRGDNSDANGKGGNRHDRNDFTHGGTEVAEDKKDS